MRGARGSSRYARIVAEVDDLACARLGARSPALPAIPLPPRTAESDPRGVAAARGLARVCVAARARAGAVGHVSRQHVDSEAGIARDRQRMGAREGRDAIQVFKFLKKNIYPIFYILIAT